jgi:hypothetical protein
MAELALGWVEEKIITLSIGDFHPSPAGSKVVDPHPQSGRYPCAMKPGLFQPGRRRVKGMVIQ